MGPKGNKIIRSVMSQSNCTVGAPANEKAGTSSVNEHLDTKSSSRKRTKTGCLTCRQRRIKCGEERPTCQNCIKSKRDCQGYNQRVIFKEPLNALRPPASVSRLATASHQQQQQSPQFQQYEPQIQRAPLQKYEPGSHKSASSFTALNVLNFNNFQRPTSDPVITSAGPVPSHQQQFHPYYPGSDSSTTGSSPEAAAPLTPSFQPPEDYGYYLDHLEPPQLPASHEAELQYSFETLAHPRIKEQPHHDETVSPSYGWNTDRNSASQSTSYDRSTPSSDYGATALEALHHSYRNNPNYALRPLGRGIRGDQYYGPYHREHNAERHHISSIRETQRSPFTPEPQSESYPLHQFNGWQEAEAISRADSDIEPEAEVEMQDQHLKRNDLGSIMALKAAQDNQNYSHRSFNTFLDDSDTLATYQPSSSPTPLQDPMTAKIFLHFINVTGQNISLYERHPADPSLMFSGRPVPHDNQHLWSYTMPTLALTNSGLLHSMLAISSLHMAKLQETSTIPSIKHYHIALRRVAKALNSPRRGHPATLAATLLLGFYEVMSVDHQKWTSHLLGAKQLIKEINFAKKSREVKAIKKERRERHARYYAGEPHWSQRFLADYDEEVDEDFISIITGQGLGGDGERGTVIDEQEKNDTHIYTDRDVEVYENQRDLFWWYCKQDVYQSVLSGNELFIDYENWIECPPRAPMGKWEASYGTFDHVILLLGRIASFASKDLSRKKKVMKLNGGVWRPPPGMKMPGPPHGGPPQGPTSPPKVPQMPPFAGMMPSGGPATLPMGYEATHEAPKSYRDDESLEMQTAKAIKEWEEIQNAFRELTTRLGPDFRPVQSLLANPIETPFGPAYQFKSYAMAGIWMNYYMGLIVHARSHPSMPPAAQMAAGIAAAQTRAWSRELGRVCGGLVTPESEGELTTLHGSAMIECSVPMFTAAVQYQGQEEREWTVKKLRNIARLTGWQTAAVIASGCEGSWIKAAENGKGPPYSRPDGELGFGHDRPRNQSEEKGGVYWGFNGNRIGVPRVMEEDSVDESSHLTKRDRRAILYVNRDKEFATGVDMEGLHLQS